MADTYPLSLDQIQGFIDRAAEPLGWTRQYTSLVATTANAVSDALGSPPTIDVGPAHLQSQIDAVKSSLASRGKSAKTAGTYVSVWKRLSALLADWQSAATTNEEESFWARFATTFRDPRVARRRVRRVSTPVVAVATLAPTSSAPSASERSGRVEHFELTLSSGTASLALPVPITADDVVVIVEALTRELRRNTGD